MLQPSTSPFVGFDALLEQDIFPCVNAVLRGAGPDHSLSLTWTTKTQSFGELCLHDQISNTTSPWTHPFSRHEQMTLRPRVHTLMQKMMDIALWLDPQPEKHCASVLFRWTQDVHPEHDVRTRLSVSPLPFDETTQAGQRFRDFLIGRATAHPLASQEDLDNLKNHLSDLMIQKAH